MNYNKNKYNEHFNRKNTIIVLLIVIFAVAIPSFEYHQTFNFWLNFNYIITSHYTNMLLILAYIVNTQLYIRDNKRKYLIVLRYKTYATYLKNNLKDIIYINFYVFLSYLLLSMASSIIFSFGNFAMPIHASYNINYLAYLPIVLIREYFIINIIVSIYYLLLEKNNKFSSILVIILSIVLFLVDDINKVKISNFYLLYPSYFQSTIYSSFSVEIIYSLLYVVILCFIYLVTFKIFTKKKRDMI